MSCVMTRAVGDPDCEMKGPAGKAVTLKVIGVVGSASFASVRYDGAVIPISNDEVVLTFKAGSKPLTIAYTLSDPRGTAELHEKCDQNTLLDPDISPAKNLKLYRVCATATAAVQGGGVVGGAAPQKDKV